MLRNSARLRLSCLLFSVHLVLALFFHSAQAKQRFEKEISTGIHYIYIKRPSARRSLLRIHVLKAALSHPRLEIRVALAKDFIGKLETVRKIARRNSALAAINGSFYDRRRRKHLPVGLIIIDGKLLNKTFLNRTTFGLISEKHIFFGIPKIKGKITNLEDGKSFTLWGINRPRKESEVILYTPEYGWRTKTNPFGAEVIAEDDQVVGIGMGDSPIPRNGYVLSFHGWTRNYANNLALGTRFKVEWGLAGGWENVSQALTGGPRLIENGRVVVNASIKEENFRGGLLRSHARTAIGLTRDGELLMVVVEGERRRRRIYGVTYLELAYLMLNMDVVEAMGLDGGGASTMYVNGKIVNRPEEGYEQGVSNALILRFKGPGR